MKVAGEALKYKTKNRMNPTMVMNNRNDLLNPLVVASIEDVSFLSKLQTTNHKLANLFTHSRISNYPINYDLLMEAYF